MGIPSRALPKQFAPNPAFTGSGGLVPPSGTTAQRPASPQPGTTRFNTDLGAEEVYQDGSWVPRTVVSTPIMVQARRTTAVALSNVAADITFNSVENTTQSGILYRDAANTARFYSAQSGLYLFVFESTDTDTAAAQTHTIRFKVNGLSYPNGGSTTIRPNTSTTLPVTLICPIQLNAGDYVTVEALRSGTSGTSNIAAGCSLIAYSLAGTRGQPGAPGGLGVLQLGAASFDNPNNASWASNALAPMAVDPTTNSLTVRAFDDTAEEGVGFTLYIPPTASSLEFLLKARASTAPAAAVSAILRLYSRLIPNNAAVGAWSAAYALPTVSVPANALFQTYQFSVALSSLGLVAGNTYQFELTRYGSSAADSLVGDLLLLHAMLSFA